MNSFIGQFECLLNLPGHIITTWLNEFLMSHPPSSSRETSGWNFATSHVHFVTAHTVVSQSQVPHVMLVGH